ncbi:MAG: HEAT repeat domain-containing protein, partial [Candidatus Wallbacteria bacterium]|nr:HEAT repeat domain-containing protein [Candidatus Wallbacteria bacterium]
LASPDPQLRIYALMQLEERIDQVAEEDVRKLLAQALADADRTVVEQARRLEAIFNQRQFGRRHNLGGYALFDDPELLKGPASNFLKGFDIEQLRAAAHDLLYPTISRLHDIALGKRPGPVEKAVDALGQLRHPGSLAVLETLTQGRSALGALAEALAQYCEPRAEELLLEMAGETDNPNRAAALERLGLSKSVDPTEVLTAAAKDASPAVRRAAAWALGDRPADSSVALMATLLDDPEEEVVLAALGAMTRLKLPATLPAIIRKLQGQTTAKVRSSGAIALARLESADSQDMLKRLLGDPDDRVRANAVEALGNYNLSYDWAMRLFPPLLRDENHRVRGNAALAVFRFNQQMALDTVKRMFDSSNKHMRAAAAYCASQIQNKETAQWLATLVLTELDTDVISSALRALGRFHRKEVLETFLKVTKHNKAEIRTLAVSIVGNLGTQAQVGFLTSMFKTEKEPTTRSAIVSALAKLAGPEGLNFLPQYLSDPDERVVANAIDGLNRSGNLEVVAHLKPMLRHPHNRIRANTVLALWNLGDTKSLSELQKMLDSSETSFVDSALYVMGAIGDSLRLVELGAHPMLPIALRDYCKRVLERGDGLRVAPISAVHPVGRPSGEEPVTDRLPLPGTRTGSRSVESAQRPASAGPEPTSSAEFLDVIETADMTPVLGTVTQRVNEEEELEKILMMQLADPDAVKARLQMFTTLYAANPYARYLMLRGADPDESESQEKLMSQLEADGGDFLAPLFLLARSFRKRGEVERSLATYLKVFQKELALLSEMIEFGLRELQRSNPTPASTVMKTIGSIIGLKPDIHALLGDFYLSEKAFDEAYRQFYMAHVAEPSDVSVALKLAFLCGKTKRKGLGREICQLVMQREGAASENYEKAKKIMERLGAE